MAAEARPAHRVVQSPAPGGQCVQWVQIGLARVLPPPPPQPEADSLSPPCKPEAVKLPANQSPALPAPSEANPYATGEGLDGQVPGGVAGAGSSVGGFRCPVLPA